MYIIKKNNKNSSYKLFVINTIFWKEKKMALINFLCHKYYFWKEKKYATEWH